MVKDLMFLRESPFFGGVWRGRMGYSKWDMDIPNRASQIRTRAVSLLRVLQFTHSRLSNSQTWFFGPRGVQLQQSPCFSCWTPVDIIEKILATAQIWLLCVLSLTQEPIAYPSRRYNVYVSLLWNPFIWYFRYSGAICPFMISIHVYPNIFKITNWM